MILFCYKSTVYLKINFRAAFWSGFFVAFPKQRVKMKYINEDRRVEIPVDKKLQAEKALEHIKLKAQAIAIMMDQSKPMKEREEEVLKIVKHPMYLPIIKLMAGVE